MEIELLIYSFAYCLDIVYTKILYPAYSKPNGTFLYGVDRISYSMESEPPANNNVSVQKILELFRVSVPSLCILFHCGYFERYHNTSPRRLHSSAFHS